jgi:quinol monooxygenase YgiN
LVKKNEPGVLFYELCRDPTTPYLYHLVEAYKDQQTQEAHVEMEYYRARGPTIVDCLEGGTYEMGVYQTV